MYDVDRENNLRRAVNEASEADAMALEEILELAAGHGTLAAETLIAQLQTELRDRLDKAADELREQLIAEALR